MKNWLTKNTPIVPLCRTHDTICTAMFSLPSAMAIIVANIWEFSCAIYVFVSQAMMPLGTRAPYFSSPVMFIRKIATLKGFSNLQLFSWSIFVSAFPQLWTVSECKLLFRPSTTELQWNSLINLQVNVFSSLIISLAFLCFQSLGWDTDISMRELHIVRSSMFSVCQVSTFACSLNDSNLHWPVYVCFALCLQVSYIWISPNFSSVHSAHNVQYWL